MSEKVESTPEAIATLLKRYGPIERAVIETGRMSPAICLGLRELGIPVVCIDARQAHQSLKVMNLKKARIALARRLAVIMHAMLRDGTLFQA